MDVRTICLGHSDPRRRHRLRNQEAVRRRRLSAFRRGELRLDLPRAEPADRRRLCVGPRGSPGKTPRPQGLFDHAGGPRRPSSARCSSRLPKTATARPSFSRCFFRDLLPESRVSGMLDAYIEQSETEAGASEWARQAASKSRASASSPASGARSMSRSWISCAAHRAEIENRKRRRRPNNGARRMFAQHHIQYQRSVRR